MGIHNLDNVFQPESVAVVGATEKSRSVGSAVMLNLINGGYKGRIHPVNPRHATIFGKPAFSSISDLDESPDLVVIATPITSVPEIIRSCAAKKAGGAIIISAGGKETGETGRELEGRIKQEAEDSGLRLIGPNCLGIYSSASALNASFAGHIPQAGEMAFISQSGAVCTAVLDLAVKERMGFSYFVSLGSMLDVDFGDVIDYIGSDPSVSSIVMYIENLSRIRNFMSAARAVSRVKPIIALKAGRSQAGAKAAASHTGAMAGEDAVYDVALRRAGIIRVKTFEELFDCAEILSKQSRIKGPELGIITNAGGPGVMAADALSDYGIEPPRLSDETIDKLNRVLPEHWSRANPIDILGDAPPQRYRDTVDICLKAPEISGLLVMLAPQALTDPTEVADSLSKTLVNARFPVFTSWLGQTDVEKGRQIFNDAGIPTFNSPERAIRAFVDMVNYARNIDMLQEIPSNFPKKLSFDNAAANRIITDALTSRMVNLTEVESKNVLAAYGIPTIPTRIAQTEKEAVQSAAETGFPVALKIYSRDISHKTEADGVALNLNTESEVKSAFHQVVEKAAAAFPKADISGVTISPMVASSGYELILGAKMDPDFGPVILFGLGGIYTEIIKDKALALPPLNRLLARRLIEGTKIYRLLKGYRNKPPVDLMRLEEIILRLSHLVVDFSEIAELDINPLIIDEKNAWAVDARIVLAGRTPSSPMHLVISPYPAQYEAHCRTGGGIDIFIRPIRPEDAPLLSELFQTLSQQTIYFRFFSPLKTLPHSMLARFTQVDYDREIALVALSETSETEKLLGAARVINAPDQENAEFSILVGDRWHGKGIGAELLKRCLEIAKARGLQSVHGVVLSENTQMLELGRKLGFEKKRGADPREIELTIQLSENNPTE
ncbi:MAG: bifunctional acetate--CoA ligase family protein/GNAT family N-acetyltransferase [Desulfobacterales bacterium]